MNARAPHSRLLARLDTAIAKTRNPIDAACLRAERAGFLARHGHFDEARAELDALHAQFDRHPNPAVSAWLCIAEGWHLHFSSLSSAARDKMKRAQALSAAAGLTQLHALSSAWLAHMDYSVNDIESLVRNVSLALRLASPDNHPARARACMVVAVAYDFAERLDRAQPWYARAREHAVADGDETTQSALNYNISAHRVHHAMQAAVFGGDVQDQARYALAGAECAGNFDEWVGTTSLHALLPMQRACIASVQGQHAEALALYEKHLADAQKQGLDRLTSNYLADMAWCRWHLGDRAGASSDARAAADAIDASMHIDDQATAHGRLGQLFKLLGEEEAALHHGARGRDCWAEHRLVQEKVAGLLDAAQL
jgi:tetratricopeptide (TPR) repeat protein